MKFTIDAGALADAVAWAARAVPAKPIAPVMAGLLLEAAPDGPMAGGVISLSGFDYETSGRAVVAADVTEAGRVLLPGKRLADIVKTLPGKPVELTTDGPRVLIRCGAAKFNLLTMPVEDYPTLPQAGAASGKVPGGVFAEAVSQVAPAAGRDEKVAQLCAIHLVISGDEITMCATDRYRLAVRRLGWIPVVPDIEAEVTLKATGFVGVAKAIGGQDVKLSFDGNMTGFDVAGRTATTLISGEQYPKVLSLMPKQFAGFAVVPVESLTDMVRRVAVVAERNYPILLIFDGNVLTVQAASGADADGEDSIDAYTSDPGEYRVSMNPQYLLDALGAITQPYMRLSWTGLNKPIVITGQDVDGDAPDDQAYRHLIMPQRMPEPGDGE